MSDELKVHIAFSTEGDIAMASENKELIEDMVRIKNKTSEKDSAKYGLISLTYSKIEATLLIRELVSKEKG